MLFLCIYRQTNPLNTPQTDGFSACCFCSGSPVSLSSPVRSLKVMLKDLKCIAVYLFWEARPLYLFCCLETAASFKLDLEWAICFADCLKISVSTRS